MNRAKFEKVVKRAVDQLPAQFKPYLESVQFVVEDWPSDDLLESLGFDPDVDTLLGFYDGVPITDRSDGDFTTPGFVADTIYVFREPLLEMCETEEDLIEEIQNPVIHEVAHHFGFDEDEIDRHGFA